MLLDFIESIDFIKCPVVCYLQAIIHAVLTVPAH